MKRALLLPLKVVSRQLFLAVLFTVKVVIAAHQAKLEEYLHQGGMALPGCVLCVPNRVGVKVTGKNSRVFGEQIAIKLHRPNHCLNVGSLLVCL